MTTAAAVSQPTWRDGKRYAWLLGVVVPTLPFIVYGPGAPDRVGGVLVLGPAADLRGVPAARSGRSAWTPSNPPDSVLKWLEQDRYYRWCTYAFLPLQYAGLVVRVLRCGQAAS